MCEFRDFLSSDNSHDIMGIAETHFGPQIDNNIIDIPGYSVLRQDRNTQGGGIAIYIRENFKAKV